MRTKPFPARTTRRSGAARQRPSYAARRSATISRPIHHRGHGTRGALGVGSADRGLHRRRDDLPPEAPAVAHPAAPALGPAVREGVPVAVDLLLIARRDRQRHRLGRLHAGAAVQQADPLAVELEVQHEGGAAEGRVREVVRVARGAGDPRAGEQVDVEPGRLLDLLAEPEGGGDARHGCSSCPTAAPSRAVGPTLATTGGAEKGVEADRPGLSVAPPRIHGLTGVPVNPIAVF